METLDYNPKHWAKPCPKYDCRKDNCKCGMKFVSIPAVLGNDSDKSPVAPKNGAYCNTIVRYESNGDVYAYSKEGIPVLLNNDHSISGTMLVTLTPTHNGEEYNYTWSSEYSYDELVKNLEKIRIESPEDWFCIGHLSDFTPIKCYEANNSMQHGIIWEIEFDDFRYGGLLSRPEKSGGQVIYPAYLSSSVENNKVDLTKLPILELEPYATEIPDGTTFVIPFNQSEILFTSNTYDCKPIVTQFTGHFIVLPVKRRVGNSSLYDVTEQCLVTNAVVAPSGVVPTSYRYKTFEFNGKKYKMTYTSQNSSGTVWVINKIMSGVPTPLTISNADTASWIIPGDNAEFGITWREGTIISEDLTFIDGNTSASVTLSDLFNRLENREQFILTVPFDSLATNESIWGSRDRMGESIVSISTSKSKNTVLENGVTTNAEIYSGLASLIYYSNYDNQSGYGEFIPVGVGRIGDRYIFTTKINGYDYS